MPQASQESLLKQYYLKGKPVPKAHFAVDTKENKMNEEAPAGTKRRRHDKAGSPWESSIFNLFYPGRQLSRPRPYIYQERLVSKPRLETLFKTREKINISSLKQKP
ncbi:hypothetical protein AVEN_275213-1 [Araneus ventricosus]|uniref:Uncharacterized protein n=1 Tax=Araneus ventricosus TaxID=182803 RepID=A0A4Y2NPF2_ARAVE|nr:hypothetical protein AVEN_275213-1 [Araneus ventricosus]